MEHREPPRIAPGDVSIESATTHRATGPFRSHRYDDSVPSRKIHLSRRLSLLVAAILVVASLIWAGGSSLDWLANQPQYQIPFSAIQLVDGAGRPAEPPGWYHGGSATFLDNVRKSSNEPEAVPVLQTAAERLSQVFKNYAWVEDVIRVAYGPGSIHVELRYRTPVAWVQLRGGDQIMVDEEGTILPAKDINVSALGRVIRIVGDPNDGGLTAPSDPRYGVKWKSRKNGSTVDEVDERIRAAARLAGFLLSGERPREAKVSDALRFTEINVTVFRPWIEESGPRRGGLFARNAEGAAVYWGDAPGAERAESAKAEEKWAILRQWAETTEARFLVTGDYWLFFEGQLQFVCPHSGKRHRPSLAAGRANEKADEG